MTVVAAGQGRNSSLSLCGVQLLGADELLLSQRMQQPAAAGEPSVALQVHPPALQAQAATPIDGNAASCLEAPAGAAASSSWQLRLDGSFPVQAVRLVATPALAQAAKQGGGAAGGGNLTVALLDAAGLEVAAWQVPARQAARAARAAGGSAGGGTTLELPVAVYAAAVRVGGFASLCELQLLASASLPPATHRLGPLPALASSGRPAGTWQVVDGASGQPDAAASLALLDGNPTTCATFRPGPAQQNAALELQLDRPVQLAAVQLLAGGLRGLNVSIAAAPWSPGAGAPAGFAAAWAGAAACQPRLGLQPWAPANAPCKFAQPPPPGHQRPALLTDRLLVQLVAPVANASAAAPAELTLCELALYGLPAAPAA